MTIKGGEEEEDPTFLDEKIDAKQYQDNGVVPNEAVDVCPTKLICSFFCVKFSAYEDQMLKVKSGIAAIKLKKVEHNKIISQLRPLIRKDKRYREILNAGKWKVSNNTQQQAQHKFPSARSARREREFLACVHRSKSLMFWLQHESTTVVKEKSLFAEIKQLERTRDEIIANDVVQAQFQHYSDIQDSWSRNLKHTIEDQLNMSGDLEEIRRKKTVVSMKIKCLEEKVKIISKTINLWEEELSTLYNEPGEACKVLVALRKQRDAWNENHCNNISLLNIDRKHGKKQDIATLEEASYTEVEQFMFLWNSDETFRRDYMRSMLRSLNKHSMDEDTQ
ncbi:Proton pump-interactor [Thalictrum thalictroides]|uniref:Proton pump-interactor n=1 Tax=Thalictrum thalictroides TaxID=46969 RepID=A0A7J6W9Y6_THATH|nr:Proton pump-interactor [Thalictrum thalictroides]